MSGQKNLLSFKVVSKSLTETKSEVSIRHFKLTVDEPKYLGGTDEGPNPIEYLLSALAGCLSITALKVAEEKGVKVESLTLEIAGRLDPSRFLGKVTDARSGLQEIEVKVSVEPSSIQDKMKEILKEAEDRCPVSDTLSKGTKISV